MVCAVRISSPSSTAWKWMDRPTFGAPSLVQLDHYCERRAVAVSRLSMRIFGEETPAGERVAADLGRAVQLTYILHNLAEDAKRHRLYLPRELLHAHGIFGTTPSWVLAQPALPKSATIWLCSLNCIMWLRRRQSPPALDG